MYQQPFQPQHFAGFATHQQAQSLAGVPQNNGHYQPNHHHHQHQIPVHMQSHGNGLILDGFEHAANGQMQPQIQAANAAAAVVAMTSAAHHLHSQQAQQAMSHLQPPQPIFITTDVSITECPLKTYINLLFRYTEPSQSHRFVTSNRKTCHTNATSQLTIRKLGTTTISGPSTCEKCTSATTPRTTRYASKLLFRWYPTELLVSIT